MGCGGGEQFGDKDKAFIENSMKDADVPYGDRVVIKRFTGVASVGDPARGIQPVFSYKKIPTKAVIGQIDQQDVLYSGGVYQTGDVTMSLKENLNYVDTIDQTGGKSPGDTVLYEGHEYRILGKKNTYQLIGNTRLVTYVTRKIGNEA